MENTLNFPEGKLQQRLQDRQDAGLLRALHHTEKLVDFCSNDYLGLARSEKLKQQIIHAQKLYPEEQLGATGSRLLSGNSVFAEKLEQEIAAFHGSEKALLFNSGYAANLGLFSCLPQRGDTVITDEQIHSSVIDGCRIGFGTRIKFRHNDLSSLEDKLRNAKGTCYVAIESLYSMSGDIAPIFKINRLCKQYGALLLVDEAHAFGVFGRGLVNQLGLTKDVFAVLVTFGKALGAHGAAVLGNTLLYNYLLNFSRPLIYSTALPFSQLLHIQTAYRYLQDNEELQQVLNHKIRLFRKYMQQTSILPNSCHSPIQSIIIPGNARVRQVSAALRQKGFGTYPIVSPTVAAGTERLRICLHTHNSDDEIAQFCDFFLKGDHTIL